MGVGVLLANACQYMPQENNAYLMNLSLLPMTSLYRLPSFCFAFTSQDVKKIVSCQSFSCITYVFDEANILIPVPVDIPVIQYTLLLDRTSQLIATSFHSENKT